MMICSSSKACKFVINAQLRMMRDISLIFLLHFLVLKPIRAEPDLQNDKIPVLIGFASRQIEDNFLVMSDIINDESDSSIPSLTTSSLNETDRNKVNENNHKKKKTKKEYHKFKYTNAISVEVTHEEWDALAADPDVLYIEHDHLLYAQEISSIRGKKRIQKNTNANAFQNGGNTTRSLVETSSYGLSAVQGDIDIPASETSNDCLINVCIVDSGLHVDHFDIPYSKDKPQYIKGKEFGIPNTQYWHNAVGVDHGTAVAGIMIAKGDNNEGIIGVIPDGPEKSKVCLLIARVFPDYDQSTRMSYVTDAVEWCALEDAHVINLSLGRSTPYSDTQASAFQAIYDNGALLFGSAGNKGDGTISYPASLDSVLSIAAVGNDNKRAKFSQYNKKVDLTGPGSYILTTQNSGDVVTILIDNHALISTALRNNKVGNFDFSISRTIRDCGLGDDVCDLGGSSDIICLIKRGIVTFHDKAANCEAGGGSMALIYNNDMSDIEWSLGENNSISIPVLGLSLNDGVFIKESLPTLAITNHVSSTLGYVSGTSFATPFVSAVAAKVWAARPQCTNEQIRTALIESALPLYAEGDDEGKTIPNIEYGYGLVQAKAMYDFILRNMPRPCGDADLTSESISAMLSKFCWGEDILWFSRESTEDSSLSTDIISTKGC